MKYYHNRSHHSVAADLVIPIGPPLGNVEKSRQRRSQRFDVLTYWSVCSGRQTVCGLARGKARLGVHGLGGCDSELF